MSNEKKKIEKRILHESKSASHFYGDNRYRWGEVLKHLKENKIELQDDDILEVGYTEGWDEGDSFRDAAYDLTVYRFREETDEELKKRLDSKYKKTEYAKEQRYVQYIKLKEEFDER